ncbi:hypothetical protein CEXT_755571 [Caerostris extrusa]|uniref:Uncharacterized protein n=1 Tax=Caerostris extrusa TaxID=172846 RepID=A0AAV4PG55_CAEEX|nr:hypothetical protein CEXT_755571 [Caerostris extrusa]
MRERADSPYRSPLENFSTRDSSTLTSDGDKSGLQSAMKFLPSLPFFLSLNGDEKGIRILAMVDQLNSRKTLSIEFLAGKLPFPIAGTLGEGKYEKEQTPCIDPFGELFNERFLYPYIGRGQKWAPKVR